MDFLQVLTYIGYVIVAVLVLLLMVTIHELGHYIAGRVLKFKIKEFAIGFGPKLFSKTNKRGEIISLRAFPLGGFCAFYGEEAGEQSIIEGKKQPKDPFEEEAKPEAKEEAKAEPNAQQITSADYFTAQKPWKRIIVFVAGATFNIVSAVFFSVVYLLVVGYGVPVVTDFYNTADGYANPNAQIILKDDVIFEVNGVRIDALNTYNELIAKQTAETLEFTVWRTENGVTSEVTLSGFQSISYLNEDGKIVQGLGMDGVFKRQGIAFGTVLWQAFPVTFEFGVSVLQSLGGLFTGKVKLTDMSGPVGTIGLIATYSQKNINFLFVLMPLIAVNLGVFNLLPIPSLDGSKIVFTVIEWIRKKPVKQSIEMMIHFVGIICLLGFVILIDLLKLFV